jgi:hypothetical protein
VRGRQLFVVWSGGVRAHSSAEAEVTSIRVGCVDVGLLQASVVLRALLLRQDCIAAPFHCWVRTCMCRFVCVHRSLILCVIDCVAVAPCVFNAWLAYVSRRCMHNVPTW